MAEFYVYEHWRPDTGKCFYVGKGRGRRAHQLKHRNKRHAMIVDDLHAQGMTVEIRIISKELTEDVAYTLEIERISFWRKEGVTLTNIADGGGKNSGWKLSPESRAKIGESKRGNKYRLGARLTEETKKKIAEKHVGKSLAESHKEKVAKSLSGEKNPFFGKTHTETASKKIAEANHRRVWSEESRQKSSQTHKALPRKEINPRGWRHSDETKRKMSEAAKLRWENRRREYAS